MSFVPNFKKNLFYINEETFEDSSLELFDFQYHENPIYQLYCKSLGRNPKNVKSIYDIPFLPIEFFKTHVVKSGNLPVSKVFKSSGTTGSSRSHHHITDIEFYHSLCKTIIEERLGALKDYILIALLPSYLEQGDSSLISMVDSFFTYTQPGSGYFLGEEMDEILKSREKKILIGVSYALSDLVIKEPAKNTIIIETGGMKGRRKEITREELHLLLHQNLSVKDIWSEYGMTELHSQAYGLSGQFGFPKWAKALVREINDPFTYEQPCKTGGINIIDLANVDSCAFIETKDLGRLGESKHFEVLGRFDNSEIRGCNLMV